MNEGDEIVAITADHIEIVKLESRILKFPRRDS
jgi:hypothetical protein